MNNMTETVEAVVRLHLAHIQPAINKKVDERIANQSDSITVEQGKVRRKARAIFEGSYSEVSGIVEQRAMTRDRLVMQSSDHVAKDTAFHKSNDEGAVMQDTKSRRRLLPLSRSIGIIYCNSTMQARAAPAAACPWLLPAGHIVNTV